MTIDQIYNTAIVAALLVGYLVGRWRQGKIEDGHWRTYAEAMKGKRREMAARFDAARKHINLWELGHGRDF